MTEPGPRPGVLRWIEQYSATMLQDELLAELAGELIGELIVEVPETAADADMRGALDLSTHELLRTMLGETSKDPTAEIAFPPAAVDFARTLARRGHDVGLLLRLYRVGQRVFWSRMMAVVSQEIATALGAPTPLTIRAGAEVVWAWLATGGEPALGRIADVATLRSSPALRVAVGIPAPGLAGFRGSHREAVRAQDVAINAEGDAAVTYYRDVEVVSCLSADQEAMRALVIRERRLELELALKVADVYGERVLQATSA